MKALTVRQPWASLIVAGIKDVENRTWATNYRGPLVIHAAQAIATKAEWEHAELIASVVRPDATMDRPQAEWARGCAIGVVQLSDIELGCDCSPWAFEGHHHWKLTLARAFDEPIPATGRLGLWQWEGEPS